jgi:hypothetical protein
MQPALAFLRIFTFMSARNDYLHRARRPGRAGVAGNVGPAQPHVRQRTVVVLLIVFLVGAGDLISDLAKGAVRD